MKPDPVEIIAQDVSDNRRDESAGRDVSIGSHMEAQLSAGTPRHGRFRVVARQGRHDGVIKGDGNIRHPVPDLESVPVEPLPPGGFQIQLLHVDLSHP